jgi:hypothetical protein
MLQPRFKTGVRNKEKRAALPPFSFLVERGGFEPPKASPTDLQSAPFGQLGNLSVFLVGPPGFEPGTDRL